jgi:hypothetical protein
MQGTVLFDCTPQSLSGTVLGEFVAGNRKEVKKNERYGARKKRKNRIAEIEKKETTRKYKNKHHRKGIRMEDTHTKWGD